MRYALKKGDEYIASIENFTTTTDVSQAVTFSSPERAESVRTAEDFDDEGFEVVEVEVKVVGDGPNP